MIEDDDFWNSNDCHWPSANCREAFDRWFYELEGFHVREERFWDAVDRRDTGELLDWLQVAFQLGYKAGRS